MRRCQPFPGKLPRLLCLTSLMLATVTWTASGARQPNILVILADDLGWGEMSCQGNPQVPTPHIDSLASNGVRFTSGYVSGPYCSPTRAGLMTGRYQQRFGHEFNPGNEDLVPANFGLTLKEKTIGDRLKAAGYVTGWFGKSHLGYQPEFHPLKRGFDQYWREVRSCCFFQFENSGVAAAVEADFGGEEFLEGLAFG